MSTVLLQNLITLRSLHSGINNGFRKTQGLADASSDDLRWARQRGSDIKAYFEEWFRFAAPNIRLDRDCGTNIDFYGRNQVDIK